MAGTDPFAADGVATTGDRRGGELALRYLRGYPLRTYRVAAGGRVLVVSGPRRPEELLAEPRVEERFDADDYMPYWSDLWPASAQLADYLLSERIVPVGGAGVAVELGCGLGLGGIAAGLLGWRVVLTDYDLDGLAHARANAMDNGLREVQTRLVDWRRPPADLRADLVVAADVLYETSNHRHLLGCVGSILTGPGMAIIADPRRDGAQGFGEAARAAGFDVSVGSWDRRPGAGGVVRVDLYLLRKRSCQ